MKKLKDISLCIDVYGGCKKCKNKKCIDRNKPRKELLKKVLKKIKEKRND